MPLPPSGVGPEPLGVYVHGSAVLGGFRAARGDVDVPAVVAGSGTEADQRAMGEAVAETAARCPGTGPEMSVISAATAAGLGSCPFEVHIRTGATETAAIARQSDGRTGPARPVAAAFVAAACGRLGLPGRPPRRL
ncbi:MULTISPECIES: hypothetical protein [unclassified Streptomyces]|uniref:hypothetical protein n=1 Tax=unclassified Streptomyces TaxID=2593676 RepID=UPI0037FD7537